MRLSKRFAASFALALAAGLLSLTTASAAVSFDYFASQLGPHGQWTVSASYGRVWQPSVYRPGWNPYYDGHWVESDLGNTWVSDYPWGSIPYHYGTWVMDPAAGWVWVPGYTWAPSWVVFRTGPGYIGWAPVPPRFQVGISIGPGDCGEANFVFVPERAFLQPRIRTVIVPRSRTTIVYNRTKIVDRSIRIENNVVVNRGLSPRDLQRVTGRPVRPVPIERCGRAGSRVKRDEIQVGEVRRLDGLRAAQPVRATKETDPRTMPHAAIREHGPQHPPQPQPQPRARAEQRTGGGRSARSGHSGDSGASGHAEAQATPDRKPGKSADEKPSRRGNAN